MERIFDGKYHYNEEMYSWERADREQWYKGIKIVSVTYHYEWCSDNHRFYECTWKDGTTSSFRMNKRFTFQDLKNYIDFKEKYGEL